jgi:adenylate cyclase
MINGVFFTPRDASNISANPSESVSFEFSVNIQFLLLFSEFFRSVIQLDSVDLEHSCSNLL